MTFTESFCPESILLRTMRVWFHVVVQHKVMILIGIVHVRVWFRVLTVGFNCVSTQLPFMNADFDPTRMGTTQSAYLTRPIVYACGFAIS